MGLLKRIKMAFARNKLGEMLVMRGKITRQDLRMILKLQAETGQSFGKIARQHNLVTNTDIRTVLFEQMAIRAVVTAVSVFIGITSFSSHPTSVKASPFGLYINKENAHNDYIQTVAYHPNRNLSVPEPVKPNLFGSQEISSNDISAFKKWTAILDRMDQITFRDDKVNEFKSLSTINKIKAVNEYVNQFRYIEDKDNFGKSDYWATPAEFFARGGDCEDFAIAKYAMLKELGIRESDMRLAIVQDKIKNIPHAILIVYTAQGAYVLDNQIKLTMKSSEVDRYKPIYSINSESWWRHIS
jgi:predicted transglutaminase-like cysteine proteinase